MILIIDTTNDNETKVILAKNQDSFVVKKASGEKKQAEKLLVLIDKVLPAGKMKLSIINGLGVVSGPGRFTSLRIGVVTANTIAYALKIPVVGIKFNEFVSERELVAVAVKKLAGVAKKFVLSKNIILPYYDKKPNIG